jgi:hypothetical protein
LNAFDSQLHSHDGVGRLELLGDHLGPAVRAEGKALAHHEQRGAGVIAQAAQRLALAAEREADCVVARAHRRRDRDRVWAGDAQDGRRPSLPLGQPLHADPPRP